MGDGEYSHQALSALEWIDVEVVDESVCFGPGACRAA
jgi:hypothetical protein